MTAQQRYPYQNPGSSFSPILSPIIVIAQGQGGPGGGGGGGGGGNADAQLVFNAPAKTGFIAFYLGYP